MSFSEILHGIQSGNAGDLDTARSLYMKISCVRTRPLIFFVCQGKAPPDIPENWLGHVTALLWVVVSWLFEQQLGPKSFGNSRVALKRAFCLPTLGLIGIPLMGLVQWALLKRAVLFRWKRGALPIVHLCWNLTYSTAQLCSTHWSAVWMH